ncbi:MAG: DUF4234 domain-containing protein [Lachnospiraceae bacterium]|nr:DUF4234 domain-containing protein [Lachnospiraceae bacterium]MBP5281750.1 DUF4234 domain-containing protein [Lachnospiraceae bacterium]
MFCSNCGTEVPDGSNNCPNCGAPLSTTAKASDMAKSAFDEAGKSFSSAFNDIRNDINNNGNIPTGSPLKTDRGLLVYILLTIITCGLYGYYFLYAMARDVNIACEGDGESTAGLIAFILLSFVTCGFYAYFWYYKLGNRLAANAPRYGMSFQENGTTIILWCIIGAFVCGIGPFVAMHILIKNTNAICAAYNRVNGLA